MADLMAAKSTTIIVAALETAGATVQSNMLDYVSSPAGQTIAGLFYLLSIISALFIFASGGNYRWGRYLLIGPTLFFFLTTVRSESDGTEWSFGKKEYSQDAVVKALRGVDAPLNGQSGEVALFYKFWNVFMSELVQELISLLNLTESDSQFNFVNKVEKLLQANAFSQITDPQLKILIRLTLSSQCKEYFHHLKIVNDPHTFDTTRNDSKEIVDILKDRVIFSAHEIGLGDVVDQDLYAWMKKNELLGQQYTCQSLWEKLLPVVKKNVEDQVEKISVEYLSPEQDPQKSRDTFLQAWGHFTELYSGKRTSTFDNDDAKGLYAVDWLVARSLHHEIWQDNPDIQRQVMGVETHEYQYAGGQPLPGQSSFFNEDVAGAIRQFNYTDKYAEKGEYVNAALSLPYFQGVGLLLLSAAYPFFAMLVVMPGRAVGFFTWMGLWAWLKLWDLGFAVVMLIDNMLYAMFPKGPNIEAAELKNPGIAWMKMLEVDPMYSQALYYNLISTCLFAVPLVTAIFVKGGGRELVSIINQGWSNHAMRIAGAAASYSRSFQAQGYMKELQAQTFRDVQSADQKFLERNVGRINALGTMKRLSTALPNVSLFNPVKADLDSRIEALELRLETDRVAALQHAAYQADMTYGLYAANRAVAARYYSHDLSSNRGGTYASRFARDLASEYYNVVPVADSIQETGFELFRNAIKPFGGASN